MELKKRSIAGTMESSDCLITVEPKEDGKIQIEVDSVVQKQFGSQIESVIRKTLVEMNVSSAWIKINDKGALDCVIIARLKAALIRSNEELEMKWEV